MRRRKKLESHENLERWLVSYVDMITVLFIFFVVLYAISQIDTNKFEQLRMALEQQFSAPYLINLGQPGPAAGEDVLDPSYDNLESPLTKNPLGASTGEGTDNVSEQEAIETLYTQLQSFIRENGLQNQISLVNKPEGISLSFQEVLLFDTGKAQIKPEGRAHLEQLAELIKQVPNPISIEGHADKRPIRTREFPSNWELASARALTVLHFLEDRGVDPARMRAVTFGEYQPISEDDLQRNRRVDLIILRESANDQPR